VRGRSPACTIAVDTPLFSAIARTVQCVASADGSSSRVSRTTCATFASESFGMRDGLVLSRSRPSTPASMQRSCQRHTEGFDSPVRRMISAAPNRSPVNSTTSARQTCFCLLFRSATIADSRARSTEETKSPRFPRIERCVAQTTNEGKLMLLTFQ
jgi:hypothetical protein